MPYPRENSTVLCFLVDGFDKEYRALEARGVTFYQVGEQEWGRFAHFALYGLVLLFAAVAYFILVRALLALHGRDSVLATAVGRDLKGKVSVVIYLVAIPLAFVNSWLACGLYVLVAVTWLIPDRRIEKTLGQRGA